MVSDQAGVRLVVQRVVVSATRQQAAARLCSGGSGAVRRGAAGGMPAAWSCSTVCGGIEGAAAPAQWTAKGPISPCEQARDMVDPG